MGEAGVFEESTTHLFLQTEKDTDSSELSDSDFEYLTASVKRRRVSAPCPLAAGAGAGVEAGAGARRVTLARGAEQLLAGVRQQLAHYDEGLLQVLAWQRLRQVSWRARCWFTFILLLARLRHESQTSLWCN